VSRTLRVGALQLPAHDRDRFAEVWPDIVASVYAAARSGVELLVLPEGTVPSYVVGFDAYDPSETDAAVHELCDVARTCAIVIVAGVVRREGGTLRNSAVVVDADGTIAGVADKHFLWGFDRQWFSPGEGFAPIPTRVGRIGALVCADGRIPTIARALVERGADLLAMPTAWVTSGRDPANLENPLADVLARTRARENGTPIVCADKCGAELGCVAYAGKSQIVDAAGTVLAIASQQRPEFIQAEIELSTTPRIFARVDDLQPRVATPVSDSFRIAFAAAREIRAHDERLTIVEAQALIAPATGIDELHKLVPAVCVDDEKMIDPAFLVRYRCSGYQLVLWRASCDAQWQELFARARATELRLFVVVLGGERAFAVDPDGAVVAGTFDGYEIATFYFEGTRTMRTLVAPGTDILDEFRGVARLLER